MERRWHIGVKKEKRETIIVFNEANNEASVYTFNTDLKKRLEEHAPPFSPIRLRKAQIIKVPPFHDLICNATNRAR